MTVGNSRRLGDLAGATSTVPVPKTTDTGGSDSAGRRNSQHRGRRRSVTRLDPVQAVERDRKVGTYSSEIHG